MQRRAFAAWLFVVAPTCTGCAPFDHLLRATQRTSASSYLASLLDVAEAGAKAYFDRHPNLERERAIEEHLVRLRKAIAQVNAALAKGEDAAAAIEAAIARYQALRELLASVGVLSGEPPAGGPETDAPRPEPLDLPDVEEVRRIYEGEPP